ncbi:hypothetical protein [Flavobacterium sp.]|uniref:hypothetical protein n=1 Tax=Flavobacterium sp. TaxID=239 RepID=UPI00286D1DB8|nr:hypothetical protein [Flavobacterium sp.]
MKKLLLCSIAIISFGFANGQEQTAKGKWLIEANTGFGSGVGSTRIGFDSVDGDSEYNFGAEGGYFVIDNLAIKVGLGYGGTSQKIVNPINGASTTVNGSVFAYKIGAKYYVINTIPVELSYNGISTSNKVSGQKDPSYVGIQGGYAIFLGDNVSIEPGVRYNYSLDDKIAESIIQFNVGFALHF